MTGNRSNLTNQKDSILKTSLLYGLNRIALLSLVCVAAALSGCVSQQAVRAVGPMTEQRYELGSIERVSFSGRGDVRIVPSNESVLVVHGAPNVLDALSINISDDRLKAGPRYRYYIPSDSQPTYTLYLNELDRLSVSGSMTIIADELKGDDLTLSVSGRAEVTLNIDASVLTIRCSGRADITATGLVDQLEIHTSGSVDVKAQDLLARQVTMSTSGSSRATIWAEESLEVRSSGSTRVQYRGQPRVSQSVSGSSSVEALKEIPS